MQHDAHRRGSGCAEARSPVHARQRTGVYTPPTTIELPIAVLATMPNTRGRAAHPPLASWANRSRLNPLAGTDRFSGHPEVIESQKRIRQAAPNAVETRARLVLPTPYACSTLAP